MWIFLFLILEIHTKVCILISETRKETSMSFNEFLKFLLKEKGCQVIKRTNDGILIEAPNGQRTIMHSHGSKEIKEGTRRGILKQLGLK